MIFVGRMEPVKNIDYSLEIFTMLKKKELISNFHLIGNGSELSRLRKIYDDDQNVYFHKNASHNNIVDYLKRSKILILTSFSEGFGNVVLEAMLCKTLVVVTPVSDMQDIIGNDERGILIDYNDKESNLKKITNILQNDKKRKTITEIAFQYVLKNHSIDVLKKQYQSIILKDK
jgi:glycosyltransferase involved in cell wall biosynthesis